jgi:hypothetical protein
MASASLGRRSLRSTARGDFLVLLRRTSTTQRRAFSVVGPSVWNELPSALRSLPLDCTGCFYARLKSFLLEQTLVWSASEWRS